MHGRSAAVRLSSPFSCLIAALLMLCPTITTSAAAAAAARSQDPTPFVWDIDVEDPAIMDKKQVVAITRKDPDYKWFATGKNSKVRISWPVIDTC